MEEIIVEAKTSELDKVQDFVNTRLDEYNCLPNSKFQIDLALEEIFVNIANYAYSPKTGKATIRCEVLSNPLSVIIQFLDGGIPYNPLKRDDPDVSLATKDRQIGGLGIFLTKKTMDNVNYEYKDGKNILTIRKNL